MKYKLSDICDIYDGPHATPAETLTGPIFLGIKNINAQCELDLGEVKHLSEKDFCQWTKRVTPREDDIVFSYEATLNRYAIIPNNFYGCLGRRLAIARVRNKDIVNPHFLYYYFCSPAWNAFILSNKVIGSTVLRVSIEEYPNYEVELPDIEIQNRIAAILDNISDKKKLNNSICTDLEAMAKQIYDYWFVQFDFPDANGNPYKSSGGKMVWCEKLDREIPEGWDVKSVGELCHENRGVSYTAKDLKDNGVHMLTLGCANKDGSFNETGIQSFDGKYSDDKVLKPFDLIIYNTDMSKDKFIAGRTIVVPDIFEDGKNIISSHHLTTMHFDDDRLKWMFYATSATNWFREYIKGFVAGTNVLGLDYVGVANFNMVIPEDNCLTDFADKLYKIEQQKSNLFKENQQLAELRDFLLPMLMNGQIKIGA